MLSDFVRGRFLVVAVLIALFAGLAFFSADYSFRDAGRTGSENCFIKVYDRCYRLKEAQQLAQFYRLANDLFLVDFATSLFGEERLDTDVTDFVMGLIVLRREAEKLGVAPTEEEVAKAGPNLPRFQIQTNLDEEYVVNNFLGPFGLSTGDLDRLVKDYLSWQRIQDLLAAGLTVPQSEIEKQYVRDAQRFTASLAEFNRADFSEKVEVTDAEIQAYYDSKKDSLLTEEKRAFTLVKFSPPAAAEDATEEQKAIQAAAFPNRVNKIWSELAKNPEQFDQTATAAQAESNPEAEAEAEAGAEAKPEPEAEAEAEAGAEAKPEKGQPELGPVEVTPLAAFPVTSPPEALKELSQVLGGLFSPSLNLGRPVTLPLEQEDGSFLVFKLTEELPPAPMSLEEAKEQIRKVLKLEKTEQLAQEAANEARGKIAEALEAGKSIAEAAKSAGVELQPLDPFSKNDKPKEIEDPNALVAAALKLQPQSVSEVFPLPLAEGFRLLVVDKIELVKDENADQEKRILRSSAEREFRRALFQAWFNRVRNESGAQRAQSIPTRQPEESEAPAGGPPASS